MGPTKVGGRKKKSEKLTVEDEAQVMISEAHKQRVLVEKMNYLGSLRSAMEKAENENVRLRNEVRQVERDRTDIIMYLRRQLGEKCEEALELKETNSALAEGITGGKEEFNEKMKTKEEMYNEMVENLTTVIKELNNKLGHMEEYRNQRDLLLDKSNKLESYLETMKVRAMSIEKEYEKANLIDKDRMRREMEEKLCKFKVDIGKATKARIAAATQNVINENIAINNEMALLIQSWQKLNDQNETLSGSNRYLANEIAIERVLREKLMTRNVAQAELIDRMAYEYMKINEFHMEADQLRRIVNNLETHIAEKENDIFRFRKEGRRSQLEKKTLANRIHDLQQNLTELRLKHDRNTALMVEIREELCTVEDQRVSTLTKISSTPNSAGDVMEKYDHVFNRLAELLDKDWLLEVTLGALGESVSLATVVGPFPKTEAPEALADRSNLTGLEEPSASDWSSMNAEPKERTDKYE